MGLPIWDTIGATADDTGQEREDHLVHVSPNIQHVAVSGVPDNVATILGLRAADAGACGVPRFGSSDEVAN